jgi:hypothetical protein
MESEAHALDSAVELVVLPEERGMADLAGQLPCELLRNASPGIVKVPEDQVICRVKRLWSQGKRAVGVVLGARLEEERLKRNTRDIRKLQDLNYYDPESIFGRPELCVLSKWGMNWSSLPDELTIAYQRKFENLAREYIAGLVRGGYKVEAIPMDDCMGDQEDMGEIDLAIGTLCKGAVLEKTGMWPLDRIWDEGPILIGA